MKGDKPINADTATLQTRNLMAVSVPIMFYLITQIVFILAIAIILGIGLGWWVRSQSPLTTQTVALPEFDDPFDARFRLEQCHRDNAALRRELKEAGERADKLQTRLSKTNVDNNMLERIEAYETRIQALLEDLQMRDDTIAILERELQTMRSATNT